MHLGMAGAIDGFRKLPSSPYSGACFASCVKRTVNDRQEIGAFAGVVHPQSPPVAEISQVCEETGTVFMKMQKSSASDIKYSGPPLDKLDPRPEADQQIVQRLQGACASVFHAHSAPSWRPRSVRAQACNVAPIGSAGEARNECQGCV
jgi:hypothetical protein